MALKESDYYSLHRILTRNAVWNFIIGARGLGKTFDAKRHVVRDFLKNGWQFIYLRRTAEELRQGAKETWFADIAEFFPEFEFRINGMKIEVHELTADKNDWQTMGFFQALSQAGGKKSVPFPKVRWIIYDEIFPDNMMFLRNEVTMFEEFYNTVDRWTDRTRVLFLSNAVMQANPYFSAFRVDTSEQRNRGAQFASYCNGFICVELADYGGFSTKVSRSRFGEFLLKHDSDYANYAINNRFLDDGDQLLEPLPEGCGYSFTLDTEESGVFGVWSNFSREEETLIYRISRRVKNIQQRSYTLNYRNVDKDMIYLKKSDNILAALIRAYRTGRIRFDTRQVKADFLAVIGTLLGK